MKKLTQDEVNHFFGLLQEACELAGWNMAFDSEADVVEGMIIGNAEYITNIVDALDGSVDDFEGYDEINDLTNKKKLH